MPQLEIITSVKRLEQVFDRAHNPPVDPNIEEFDHECRIVHSRFEDRLLRLLPEGILPDGSDVNLSPRAIASSRKIGLLIEDDRAAMPELTGLIVDFLITEAPEYMVTIHVTCEAGEGYLSFTAARVAAFGDSECLQHFKLTPENPLFQPR